MWQIQISLFPFRTSSSLKKPFAWVREDAHEGNKSKLGTVTSLDNVLLGNGGISTEDLMRLLFSLLVSGSFQVVLSIMNHQGSDLFLKQRHPRSALYPEEGLTL